MSRGSCAGITESTSHLGCLSSLVDRVSHECRINYRISLDLRNKVASPSGLSSISLYSTLRLR